MTYKKGSIISVKSKATNLESHIDVIVHIIGMVNKVQEDKLYIRRALISVNNDEYLPIKKVYPSYEGELKDSVKLCDGNEFDIVIDSKIIPRKLLKNL